MDVHGWGESNVDEKKRMCINHMVFSQVKKFYTLNELCVTIETYVHIRKDSWFRSYLFAGRHLTLTIMADLKL